MKLLCGGEFCRDKLDDCSLMKAFPVKEIGHCNVSNRCGLIVIDHTEIPCLINYAFNKCTNLFSTLDNIDSCNFCNSAANSSLHCIGPNATNEAPTTTQASLAPLNLTNPINPTNISAKHSILVRPSPSVAETPSILIYALGSVGAAVAIPFAAYPFICWVHDGLYLRKKDWAWAPVTRAQQFFGWCRGKNKTVESSIEMDSRDDNKAEFEGDSFLSKGDMHASAKNQKGWIWTPITRAQQFFGWCLGKNKSVESSIEMDSSDNKAELEGDYFLSEGDENASAKEDQGS